MSLGSGVSDPSGCSPLGLFEENLLLKAKLYRLRQALNRRQGEVNRALPSNSIRYVPLAEESEIAQLRAERKKMMAEMVQMSSDLQYLAAERKQFLELRKSDLAEKQKLQEQLDAFKSMQRENEEASRESKNNCLWVKRSAGSILLTLDKIVSEAPPDWYISFAHRKNVEKFADSDFRARLLGGKWVDASEAEAVLNLLENGKASLARYNASHTHSIRRRSHSVIASSVQKPLLKPGKLTAEETEKLCEERLKQKLGSRSTEQLGQLSIIRPIHGKKGMSVREQQEQHVMGISVKEKAARMKQEEEGCMLDKGESTRLHRNSDHLNSNEDEGENLLIIDESYDSNRNVFNCDGFEQELNKIVSYPLESLAMDESTAECDRSSNCLKNDTKRSECDYLDKLGLSISPSISPQKTQQGVVVLSSSEDFAQGPPSASTDSNPQTQVSFTSKAKRRLTDECDVVSCSSQSHEEVPASCRPSLLKRAQFDGKTPEVYSPEQQDSGDVVLSNKRKCRSLSLISKARDAANVIKSPFSSIHDVKVEHVPMDRMTEIHSLLRGILCAPDGDVEKIMLLERPFIGEYALLDELSETEWFNLIIEVTTDILSGENRNSTCCQIKSEIQKILKRITALGMKVLSGSANNDDKFFKFLWMKIISEKDQLPHFGLLLSLAIALIGNMKKFPARLEYNLKMLYFYAFTRCQGYLPLITLLLLELELASIVSFLQYEESEMYRFLIASNAGEAASVAFLEIEKRLQAQFCLNIGKFSMVPNISDVEKGLNGLLLKLWPAKAKQRSKDQLMFPSDPAICLDLYVEILKLVGIPSDGSHMTLFKSSIAELLSTLTSVLLMNAAGGKQGCQLRERFEVFNSFIEKASSCLTRNPHLVPAATSLRVRLSDVVVQLRNEQPLRSVNQLLHTLGRTLILMEKLLEETD